MELELLKPSSRLTLFTFPCKLFEVEERLCPPALSQAADASVTASAGSSSFVGSE